MTGRRGGFVGHLGPLRVTRGEPQGQLALELAARMVCGSSEVTVVALSHVAVGDPQRPISVSPGRRHSGAGKDSRPT